MDETRARVRMVVSRPPLSGGDLDSVSFIGVCGMPVFESSRKLPTLHSSIALRALWGFN